MIKTIGTNSRLQLEKIMKKKVNLFIKIKVAQKINKCGGVIQLI